MTDDKLEVPPVAGEPSIAVFHHRFKAYGGAERVANAIAEGLGADLYTLYVSEACEEKTDATPLFQEKYTDGYSSKFFQRLAIENITRSIDIEHVDLSEYDIVITSGDYAHFYLPTDDQTHIHYLHTPNRDLYNASDFRQLSSGRLSWVKTIYFKWLRTNDQCHAEHVDHWLCNSEVVRDRCRRFYGPDPDTVEVIEPPVAWDDLGPVTNDREDYWVTVGRLVPAKRVEIMVDAFEDLDSQLLIAGDGSERDRLEPTAQDNVEFLGYVSDERKHELLRSARGFLFMGERECFGMSIAEALSAGTPVVGVREGNLPYLVGDEDGLLVDADPADVEEAVRHAEGVEWDNDAIRQRAEVYSEDRFKEQLKEVIDSVKADRRTRVR